MGNGAGGPPRTPPSTGSPPSATDQRDLNDVNTNTNQRKFIDTGYIRSSDFGGYNRKTHCALSGYNRWL